MNTTPPNESRKRPYHGASRVVYCGDCMARFAADTPHEAADMLREHKETCEGPRDEAPLGVVCG